MSTFAQVVDELAAGFTDPMRHADQGPEFANGADTGVQDLADALKAAEGERFRIDQDKPKGDQAYVIRIESADGRRLAGALSVVDVARSEDLPALFATAARGIATVLLLGAGWRPPDDDALISDRPQVIVP